MRFARTVLKQNLAALDIIKKLTIHFTKHRAAQELLSILNWVFRLYSVKKIKGTFHRLLNQPITFLISVERKSSNYTAVVQ